MLKKKAGVNVLLMQCEKAAYLCFGFVVTTRLLLNP